MPNLIRKHAANLILIAILFLGAGLRFYGYNWDNGHYLHPDERFVSLTAVTIQWPDSLAEYLNPETSKLSPYNTDSYKAYIYGTLPLFLTKYMADGFGKGVYGEIHEIGRIMSAIFDVGTILLVYLIAREWLPKRISLMAAAFYAVTVLAIQFSHFFTVESYLVFFTALTFKLLLGLLKKDSDLAIFWSVFSGVAFGLTIASKISGVLFAGVILYILALKFWRIFEKQGLKLALWKCSQYAILIFVASYASLRLAQPYLFASANWLDLTLQPDFHAAFEFQRKAIAGEIMFPPQWQWVDTTAYLFPLSNLVFWGLGIVLAAAALLSMISYFVDSSRELLHSPHLAKLKTVVSSPVAIMTIWVLALFFYGGANFVKSMRYLVPVLPFIAILAAYLVYRIGYFRPKWQLPLFFTIFIPTFLWALSYTNIYSQDTTRLAASKWIHQNIAPDKVIANEHWDDPLPLMLHERDWPVDHYLPNKSFPSIMMEVYNPDDEQKLIDLYDDLTQADYLFISSARASGSIRELPRIYPYMSRYYDLLESGELGFVLEQKFVVYPNLFGIQINDEAAEETFWVYDHPSVRIYRKQNLVSEEQFRMLMTQEL